METALDRIRRELDVGHFGSIEASSLQPSEADQERPGSKPLFTLQDEHGRRYMFKLSEPALAAAETAAYELRRLGRRPAVPARTASLDPDGKGKVSGLLKPYIQFDTTAELTPDTSSWSPEQRAVLLIEHAWEWLLDNLDTNTSQYALLGEHALPVNIDWDRAFFSDGRSELSRFAKYKATLPNARTFLYADYVERKVELPLRWLTEEARRIRRLPRTEVARIVGRYARVRFEDDASRVEFVTRILRRQRHIEREFDRFVRDLIQERRGLRAPAPTLSGRVRQIATVLWNHWQVVLNAILRGPVGKFCRGALTLVRGRRRSALVAADALAEDQRSSLSSHPAGLNGTLAGPHSGFGGA